MERTVAGIMVAWALMLTSPTLAQKGDDADVLNAQVIKLYFEGKYAEAIPLAQRSLAIRKTVLGPDHPDVATALNNLATLYGVQSRYADAEPLFRRSFEIREKVLGAEHESTATTLQDLADSISNQGRHGEAEALHRRAVSIREKILGPEHVDTAFSLNQLAWTIEEQGRHGEAEPLLRRALAIREKILGPQHVYTAFSLDRLAGNRAAQSRYADAEPLFRRSLEIREKVLGAEHESTATTLQDLADSFSNQGRHGEAEALHRRAVSIREKILGPEHVDTAFSLNQLAWAIEEQGRHAEAEPLLRRALSIREKILGPEHVSTAFSLDRLAGNLTTQGRYADAEPHFKRSLAVREKVLGAEHESTATTLQNLADSILNQGRHGEAEPLLRKALSIREKLLGPDHPDNAASIAYLAVIYLYQYRFRDAEPLFKRAIAILEKAAGPEHHDLGASLGALGMLYWLQERHDEAEPLLRRAFTIQEKALGSDHPQVANAAIALASLYAVQSRHAEAERLFQRALAIHEKASGTDHPQVGLTLHLLGQLYQAWGRYADAEALIKRGQAIWEKTLGPKHWQVGESLIIRAYLHANQDRFAMAKPLYEHGLAILERTLEPDSWLVGVGLAGLADVAFQQGDWAQAVELFERSTSISIEAAMRGTHDVGKNVTGKQKNEAENTAWQFVKLIKATHQLALQVGHKEPRLRDEMFQAAQWAKSSEAATALAQMAARGDGDPELAAIVRERQDHVVEWQQRDRIRSSTLAQAPLERDRTEFANVRRISAIGERISKIDKWLEGRFPNYMNLVRPRPLSIGHVQAQLREDEAVVLFVDTPTRSPTPEETFIWVVTKTNSRWLRSEIGTNLLQEHVATLRCGLDDSAWEHEGKARCSGLLGLDATKPRPRALPFDTARAHELYKGLFGNAEDLIKDKNLLIVPAGPLTQIPFQVLVTEPPASPRDYANAAWLAKRHAITVLPSVASLAALRRNAKPSAALEPFIGYGDPMLVGQPGCGKITIPDRCPDKETTVTEDTGLLHRVSTALAALPTYFRNGQANVAEVRRLCPLPDTAHELRCVAQSLSAPGSSIVLGEDMTEAAVKKAPLDRYRVVHFATHGLLAGETEQLAKDKAEPALVFTPPDAPTEDDDGLLTASEVAALKLDADWVVMSACNTAGGGAPGAEALSGLARAFFYAGARALLVSHWPVNSYAATMLTSHTFAELKRDPTLGRSEAFRRAMLAFMSDPKRRWATHPSVWAPFVVVGEGGARS